VNGRTLILVGSPKGVERSDLAGYARSVTGGFEHQGGTLDWIHLHHALAVEDSIDDLLARADVGDLILLVAPLCADSLPAAVIAAFERIVEARSHFAREVKAPGFAVLIHRGFVKPVPNSTAVDICRAFADAAGFLRFGAVTLGGGGMLGRRIGRVLEQARAALARGSPISSALRRRAERPIMPSWVYILGGGTPCRGKSPGSRA